MTDKEYLIYNNINFFNRYNSFRIKFKDIDETLENYDVKQVLKIFEELGYSKTTFVKNGVFFKIKEKEKPFEFYFHVSLKYGVCELILGGKNINTDIFVGGVYGNILDDILEYENKKQQSFPLPCFSNYNELKEILNNSLSIYEDYKTEFIKQFS
ncbi:conserved hypothetical protein [Tenacibaculum sp. 190524A02b]|uniref:Uncharacterized protein n=1 Tax=Tenacibaculum vairaonense TaxID=3137860 RepID=A0ABP1FD65_9FLAO